MFAGGRKGVPDWTPRQHGRSHDAWRPSRQSAVAALSIRSALAILLACSSQAYIATVH